MLQADLVFLAIGFAGSRDRGHARAVRRRRSTGATTSSPTSTTTGPRATRCSPPATCAAASRWSSGRSAKAVRRPAPSTSYLMGATHAAALTRGQRPQRTAPATGNRRPGRASARAAALDQDLLDESGPHPPDVTVRARDVSAPPGAASGRVSGRIGPAIGFGGNAIAGTRGQPSQPAPDAIVDAPSTRPAGARVSAGRQLPGSGMAKTGVGSALVDQPLQLDLDEMGGLAGARLG